MSILKNKNTRVIILVMLTLVVVGVLVSKFYYQNINRAVDPRIVKAREMYRDYDKYAQNNDFIRVFELLDSIEACYDSIPHYKNSFEKGVIANNRAAVYLTLALHKDSIDLPQENTIFKNYTKDSLLNLAKLKLDEALYYYINWKNKYKDMSSELCRELIKTEFLNGLEMYSEKEQNKYLDNRVKALMDTKLEIDRRLSVSYTNIGTCFRHFEEYDSALVYYAKAIELWDRNNAAQNNLNILLNRPLKKQSFIQKLFPPSKKSN